MFLDYSADVKLEYTYNQSTLELTVKKVEGYSSSRREEDLKDTVPLDESKIKKLCERSSSKEAVKQKGLDIAALMLPPQHVRQLVLADFMSHSKKPTRLILNFEKARKLVKIPWECAYLEENNIGFIALNPEFSIIRNQPNGQANCKINSLPNAEKRLLVALGNEKKNNLELKRLKYLTQELSYIQEIFPNGSDWSLTALEKASFNKLVSAFDSQPHIFHFSGHSTFNDDKGQIILYPDVSNSIADENSDEAVPVDAERLAENLAGKHLELAVLVSCKSGVNEENKDWSSVGLALHQKGIPAVVCMQESILDSNGAEFSRRFYKCLLHNEKSLDYAIVEARKAIKENNKDNYNDWYAPVLYMYAEPAGCAFSFFDSNQLPKNLNLSQYLSEHSSITKDELLKVFVGRSTELDQFKKIIDGIKEEGGYIQLKGEAGSGKSSLIAKTIDNYEQQKIPVGYFFVPTSGESAKKVAIALLASLAESANLLATETIEWKNPTKEDFARVFKQLQSAGKGGILFLDGFDQLSDAVRSKVLARFTTHIPAGIAIIISTQNSLEVADKFTPHALSNFADINELDFEELLQKYGLKQLNKDEKNSIQNKTKNIYYLTKIIDLLKKGNKSIDEVLEQLPRIEDVHEVLLQRIKNKYPTDYNRIIQPIFDTLALSQAPLTFNSLLSIILSLPNNSNVDSDELKKILANLSDFLQTSTDTIGANTTLYSLSHTLFREYLVEKLGKQGVSETHRRIAEWCKERLRELITLNKSQTEEKFQLNYALNYYPVHLLFSDYPKLEELLNETDKHFGSSPVAEKFKKLLTSRKLWRRYWQYGRQIPLGNNAQSKNLVNFWRYTYLHFAETDAYDSLLLKIPAAVEVAYRLEPKKFEQLQSWIAEYVNDEAKRAESYYYLAVALLRGEKQSGSFVNFTNLPSEKLQQIRRLLENVQVLLPNGRITYQQWKDFYNLVLKYPQPLVALPTILEDLIKLRNNLISDPNISQNSRNKLRHQLLEAVLKVELHDKLSELLNKNGLFKDKDKDDEVSYLEIIIEADKQTDTTDIQKLDEWYKKLKKHINDNSLQPNLYSNWAFLVLLKNWLRLADDIEPPSQNSEEEKNFLELQASFDQKIKNIFNQLASNSDDLTDTTQFDGALAIAKYYQKNQKNEQSLYYIELAKKLVQNEQVLGSTYRTIRLRNLAQLLTEEYHSWWYSYPIWERVGLAPATITRNEITYILSTEVEEVCKSSNASIKCDLYIELAATHQKALQDDTISPEQRIAEQKWANYYWDLAENCLSEVKSEAWFGFSIELINLSLDREGSTSEISDRWEELQNKALAAKDAPFLAKGLQSLAEGLSLVSNPDIKAITEIVCQIPASSSTTYLQTYHFLCKQLIAKSNREKVDKVISRLKEDNKCLTNELLTDLVQRLSNPVKAVNLENDQNAFSESLIRVRETLAYARQNKQLNTIDLEKFINSIENKSVKVIAYNEVASYYSEKKEFVEAVNYWEKALDLAIKSEPEQEMMVSKVAADMIKSSPKSFQEFQQKGYWKDYEQSEEFLARVIPAEILAKTKIEVKESAEETLNRTIEQWFSKLEAIKDNKRRANAVVNSIGIICEQLKDKNFLTEQLIYMLHYWWCRAASTDEAFDYFAAVRYLIAIQPNLVEEFEAVFISKPI